MVTLVELKVLAKKQGLRSSGTKAMIAKRIIIFRRNYLTKSQIEILEPLAKTAKVKRTKVFSRNRPKSKTKTKKSAVKVVKKRIIRKANTPAKRNSKKKRLNLAKRDQETHRRLNPVEKMLRSLRTFD